MTNLTLFTGYETFLRSALVALLGCLLPLRTSAVDFDLHEVGRYGGGSASSVTVSSNLVFTSNWDILFIVDISDLASPRSIGSYYLSGNTGRAAVAGHFLYVGSRAGLDVVDISDLANPTRVSRYAGDVTDVALIGSSAFLTTVEGLVTLDVSDPTNLHRVSTLHLSAGAVAVSGHLAFLVEGGASSGSLHVIDISNPVAPKRVGGCDLSGPPPEQGRKPAISGSYACVPTVAGMDIIDISNPAFPGRVGTYDSKGIQDVAFSDDLVIAAGADGVHVVDIADPAHPRRVAGYQCCDSMRGIAVVGTRAFTVGNSGVQILDLRARQSPRLVGRQGPCDAIQDVAVSGRYAYVASGADGLLIVDVQDPTRPRAVGTYPTQSFAHAVKVVGDYAYVAGGESGLEVVDIRDPFFPWRVAALEPGDTLRDVAISGKYAYLAADSAGLVTADISHPESPQLYYSYAGATVKGVAVSGNYAYVAADTDGLLILDARKPGEPFSFGVVGSWKPTAFVGWWDPHFRVDRVAVYGNVAWVAVTGIDYSTTYLIDVSDPKNPVELKTVGSGQGKVTFASGYAYFCDSGLKMFDVSKPAEPILVGETASTDYAQSVAVAGNTAYVGAYGGGWLLRAIAIQPANPQRVSANPLSGGTSWNSLALAGDFAYVTDESLGLQVYSITNRTNPQLLGSYQTTALGVTVSGTTAYVAAGARGLQVFDIQDPAHPKLLNTTDTPGTAWDVAIANGFAYVADYTVGLQIFDVRTPVMPQKVGSFLKHTQGAVVIAFSGHLAAIGNTLTRQTPTGGLVLLDMANPADPQFLSLWDGGQVSGLAISGSYAFVTGSGWFGTSFEVIDISNPSKPRQAAHLGDVTGSTITIAGTYAYVSGAQGTLVIDISDPIRPRRVGGNSSIAGSSVAVSGNHVYVPVRGLTVLDTFRSVELQPRFVPGQPGVGLRFTGPRGVGFRLERSSNLKRWEPWQDVLLSGLSIDLTDPQALTNQLRFYRAVLSQP